MKEVPSGYVEDKLDQLCRLEANIPSFESVLKTTSDSFPLSWKQYDIRGSMRVDLEVIRMMRGAGLGIRRELEDADISSQAVEEHLHQFET